MTTGVERGQLKKISIGDARITTVAVPIDGRLLHSDGAEPPYQIRHLIELETDVGIVGLGEVSPRVRPEQLQWAARQLKGVNPFNLEAIRLRLCSEKFYRMDLACLAAGMQIACLDIQAKYAGVSVCDLLGGWLRQTIPLIAYVLRKEGTDSGAAVLTNQEVVDHALQLVHDLGCGTVKLKGGAVPLEDDLEAVALVREALPHHRLRLDPNGSWSLSTALRAVQQLHGSDLEWLEDPVLGVEGMRAVARRTPIPLATNMCCIHPGDVPSVVGEKAVDVVLLDIWHAGGPWSAKQMATMCRAFGLGVAVHSGGGSCELGIGLAAQLHFAASLPGLVHAADSQYHHLRDDVIVGGLLPYRDGEMDVPRGPGLGVALDRDQVARYSEFHERHRRSIPNNDFPAYPRW